MNWNDRIRDLGCVVCRRLDRGYVPAQLHHIAQGSSKRYDHAQVPLCPEHHDPYRTGTGFHGMGTTTFSHTFRVPWLAEHGLLVWLMEDLDLRLRGKLP